MFGSREHEMAEKNQMRRVYLHSNLWITIEKIITSDLSYWWVDQSSDLKILNISDQMLKNSKKNIK